MKSLTPYKLSLVASFLMIIAFLTPILSEIFENYFIQQLAEPFVFTASLIGSIGFVYDIKGYPQKGGWRKTIGSVLNSFFFLLFLVIIGVSIYSIIKEL